MRRWCRIAPLPKAEWLGGEVQSGAVLIDVQRATSTLVTAFAHGLKRARILEEVDLVVAAGRAEELATGVKPLLGGERDFVRIPNFDLDNSPRAYADRHVVENKNLMFTSTNGARALAKLSAFSPSKVALGSFLNLRATQDFCAGEQKMLLLCSGTSGERSDEDELFAGTVAAYLAEAHGFELADTCTRDIADVATHAQAHGILWHKIMTESKNAKGLRDNGLENDLHFVSQVDRYATILPISRPESHDLFSL